MVGRLISNVNACVRGRGMDVLVAALSTWRRKHFLLFAQMVERNFHLSAAQKYCNNDIKCNLLQCNKPPPLLLLSLASLARSSHSFACCLLLLLLLFLLLQQSTHTPTTTLLPTCRALWQSRKRGREGDESDGEAV